MRSWERKRISFFPEKDGIRGGEGMYFFTAPKLSSLMNSMIERAWYLISSKCCDITTVLST